MMKLLKPAVGCVLILTAFIGLIYWENDGRERWTMEEVIVAAQDIEEGADITRNMFRTARVPKENLIKGAFGADDIGIVAGKVADRAIAENSQVSRDFFDDSNSVIEKGKSIFVIKSEWIDSRSSSLRGGDTIKIYSDTGDHLFGTYKVAFVKDDNEQEVVEADGFAPSKNILDRRMSSRPANHVEIISTLEEYQGIMEFVTTEGRGLMLVQKGDFK